MTNNGVSRLSGRARRGVSAIALLALIPAAPALAQENASTSTDEVAAADGDEILVIGTTKREENLQEVPVSATVFSGEKLEKLNVINVQDVAQQTPGFLIRTAPSNSSAVAIGLRGQAQNDVLATVDPSVGTYVDGLYWARAYGLNSNVLDVRSVQVLKGPQGTLFGRNTSAGALVIETNEPDLDEFGGSVGAQYGRFNERTGTAVLNAPLIPDKLAVRAAFTLYKRDGYIRGINPTTFVETGEKYGDRDIMQGRAKVRFAPIEDVDLILSAEFFDSETKGQARFLSNFSSALGPNGPAEAAYLLANPDLVSVTPQLGGVTPGTDAGITENLYDDPFTNTDTQTYSSKLRFFFENSTFQLINAYRKINSTSAFDLDGSALFRGSNDFAISLEQWSSELQLTGTTLGERLDYVVGGTYFQENGFDNSLTTTFPGGVPAAPLQGATAFRSNVKNEAFGLYAQGSFDITDALTLTAGIRHSWDDRSNLSDNRSLVANFAPVAPTSPSYCLVQTASAATDGNCRFLSSDNYRAWTYTAGLDYQITPDIMVYAKTAKGYRSGAQQLRVVDLASSLASLPEVNFEHEVGLKSELFDRLIRFNIAGYYNTVKDFQSSAILTTPTGVRYTSVINPADLRNIGVEADLTVRPMTGLSLSAAVALNDGKYKNCKGACAPFIRDVIDQQFTLGADYSAPLGFATLNANVSYSWTGKVNLSSVRYEADDIAAQLGLPPVAPVLAQFAPLAISDAKYDQIFVRDAAGILNARLGLTFGDALEVFAYGRNLTNERYIEHTQFLFSLTTSSIRNDPRTYGVGAKFTF